MRYTQSPDTIVHPGTGFRMHTDTAPITSALTGDDMNMLLWELNAILQAAAIAGVAFDPNTPATYTQVLTALRKMFLGRDVGEWLRDEEDLERLNFAGSSTTFYKGHGAMPHAFLNEDGLPILRAWENGNISLPNLNLAANDNSDAVPTTGWVHQYVETVFSSYLGGFRASEVGKISYVPANQASTDHIPMTGIEVSRTGAYADLWTFAQGSGMLVTDAVMASRPGCFGYGSGGVGGTTFRVPKLSGLVIKTYHNGDGTYTTNTSYLNGAYVPDALLSHNHEVLAGSSEQDAWNTFTNGRPADTTNVPTTYTGGSENLVRVVILFAQMRYR